MPKPSPKTPSTSRNVIWNWTSLGCETLIALALCPWLIYCLGTDVYGWWVLLIGLSGLGGVLDLGIRQSLSRFVAFDIAKGDRDALGGHLMTAGMLMMILGLLAAVLTFGLGWTYHERLIASGMLLPSDWVVALGILCLYVLVNYPNTVLESWLTGTERFDRLNQTRVPQEVLRGIFVAIVAGGGGGLTAMAWATLGAFTIGSLARFVLVFWAFPSIANWTVRAGASLPS